MWKRYQQIEVEKGNCNQDLGQNQRIDVIDQDQSQDLDQVQGLVPIEIELGAIGVGNMIILLRNAPL